VRYPAAMRTSGAMPTILAIAALTVTTSAGAAGGTRLVFCAPGYPGTTEQAAPTMDAFARSLERVAGVSAGTLAAAYHEDEAAGVAAAEDADLVVATLPFFLSHRTALDLRPVLAAAPVGTGESEIWALVAPRGKIASAADLAGWEVASIAGYAPAFVRGPALAGWGALPADATVRPTTRVLSDLRRAARGENVAVLLDGAQSAGLDRLPFAADLEIVARSRPMPATLVCSRGPLAPGGAGSRVVEGLGRLAGSEDGREALASVRVEAFVAAPAGPTIDALARAYDAAVAAP